MYWNGNENSNINFSGESQTKLEKWRSDVAKFSLPESGDDSILRPQTTSQCTSTNHIIHRSSLYAIWQSLERHQHKVVSSFRKQLMSLYNSLDMSSLLVAGSPSSLSHLCKRKHIKSSMLLSCQKMGTFKSGYYVTKQRWRREGELARGNYFKKVNFIKISSS